MGNSALEAVTLDQLRLFVTVADAGSFSAAARRLNRAQSVVSYGLANLENLIGVQLFDRSGRTPVLTTEGAALLPQACSTLEQASRFTARAQAITEGLETSLCIAVDAICPAELLVALGVEFHRTFPRVPLRVETEVLEAVPALVESGACQLGISGPIGSDSPTLERKLIGHLALVPVVGAEHPLAREPGPLARSAVSDHIQIVISQRVTPSPTSEGVLSRTTWRVADASTKLALIRAGLGWGNLPLAQVKRHLDDGSLRRLELDEWGPQPWRVPLWSVVAAGSPLGTAGQWLLGQLMTIRDRLDLLT